MKRPKETCHLGKSSGHHQVAMTNEYSYIHEHLETLYFISKEFNCKSILEIGTGDGDSTLAFLESLYDREIYNGLISVDINPKCKGRKVIEERQMENGVHWITADSLKLDIQGKFDLIFIDGDHGEEVVTKEIIKYAPMVKKGGWLILHDFTNPAYNIFKSYCSWIFKGYPNYDC